MKPYRSLIISCLAVVATLVVFPFIGFFIDMIFFGSVEPFEGVFYGGGAAICLSPVTFFTVLLRLGIPRPDQPTEIESTSEATKIE